MAFECLHTACCQPSSFISYHSFRDGKVYAQRAFDNKSNSPYVHVFNLRRARHSSLYTYKTCPTYSSPTMDTRMESFVRLSRTITTGVRSLVYYVVENKYLFPSMSKHGLSIFTNTWEVIECSFKECSSRSRPSQWQRAR